MRTVTITPPDTISLEYDERIVTSVALGNKVAVIITNDPNFPR